MRPKFALGLVTPNPCGLPHSIFFFFFFDETPCLPLTIKIIPQTLHFRDTLEADFIASVRSFFLPGMFITFKGDKE